MKRSMVALLGLGLVVGSALGQAPKEAPAPKSAGPALKTAEQQVGYGIGLDLGRKLKAQEINVDPEVIIRGLRDGLAGRAEFSDEQLRQVTQTYVQGLMTRRAEKGQKEADAFLAANAKKPGVVSLPSGLQYKVVKEGTGAVPKATDTVSVNYKGTLLDGSVFDASERHGGPASFQVNQVIPGWQEALQKMRVGSKWQLFVPSKLAYGPRGTPDGSIPPNSTLIFDVELLKVGGQAQP